MVILRDPMLDVPPPAEYDDLRAISIACTLKRSRHTGGGPDALKLDDLAAPADTTDLDASTGRATARSRAPCIGRPVGHHTGHCVSLSGRRRQRATQHASWRQYDRDATSSHRRDRASRDDVSHRA
jgi:hypothetical protein